MKKTCFSIRKLMDVQDAYVEAKFKLYSMNSFSKDKMKVN